MASIILTLFMIAATEVPRVDAPVLRSDSDEDDQSYRKIRRKFQNSIAAKKSYEARKKERQILLQKNTELMEMQKQLLHDKSRLEKRISLFYKIMSSFDHKSCTAASAVNANYPAVVSSAPTSATSPRNYSDNNNQALDLSMKSRRPVSYQNSTSKDTPKGHGYSQSVVVDERRPTVRDEPVPRKADKKRVRFEEIIDTSDYAENIGRVHQNGATQDMGENKSRSPQHYDEIRIKEEVQDDGYAPDSRHTNENDTEDTKQEFDAQDTCKKEQDGVREIRTGQEDYVFIPNGKKIKCEI